MTEQTKSQAKSRNCKVIEAGGRKFKFIIDITKGEFKAIINQLESEGLRGSGDTSTKYNRRLDEELFNFSLIEVDGKPIDNVADFTDNKLGAYDYQTLNTGLVALIQGEDDPKNLNEGSTA